MSRPQQNKYDVDSDEDDDFFIPSTTSDADKLDVRITVWNLEGSDDIPPPKDLMSVAFPTEYRCVHAYALQEVKCLEKLRDALWTCIGGASKFELFEHWMGRAGPGSAGQTVLLVFAPKELCATGRFRISRFANQQVKREVLRGTRSKLLGGTTSSRGAVAMPFTFLDTTFSLVSLRLVEEETEKSLDQQQKDLEKILELCRMNDNAETSASGSLHHSFLCGSFRMVSKQTSEPARSSSVGLNNSSTRRSISSRFSFTRRNTTKTSAIGSGMISDAFTPVKQQFDLLDSFEECEESNMSFEPDHVFYKSASEKLEEFLQPVSTALLSNIRCGRPPVTALFRITGKGSHILTSWSRLSGNVPIHLSSRSNYVHAKNDVAQRPRISTAPNLRKERESRSGTQDLLRKMTLVEEKYVLECTKCEGPISDSELIVPVTKDGCAYHPRCFCCDHCGVPMCPDPSTLAPGQSAGDVIFHEVEGQLLCQKSFETLYVTCCEACGGALGDEFLTLPGHGPNESEQRRFHVSCFKCGICQRPFATKVLMGDIVIEAAIAHDGMYLCEQDFKRAVGGVKCCICEHSFEKGIKIDGDIYCQKDFDEAFSGGLCAVCQQPVTDEQALTLRDGSQVRKACHMGCLKCCMCQKKIHELDQSLVEFEGQIYCKSDWDTKQATLVYANCSKCLLPIKADRVDANNNAYHPGCFTCTFCNCSLLGVKFYPSDGKVWCLNDFERFCCSDLPACASCHRTVGSADKPRAQKLDTLTWHAECFVCGNCGSNLKGKRPKVVKGKVFCEKC